MRYSWNTKEPVKLFYRFATLITWCFFKIFYHFKVYGSHHYFEGPAIIAANHASYLDPPILGVAWPEEVHFLAKEELFNVPVLAKIIIALNSHPLRGDGSDVGVLKTICNLLLEGKKVVLFPEGNRTEDNTLAPIKPGIALLVAKTKCSIVPTYIFGTFDAWPRFRSSPRFFKKLGCVFGSRIDFSAYEHMDKKEARLAITEKLADSLANLKAWYENGAKGSPP